ncbi:paraquat-inducible protein A [Pontivivens insulae]|uniref:Paraquat-inducible protein A n=1 Tax=Pontivivens insulae TaxID=1639689 RepID=A0A2R8AB85_9RHOB|nr:paraquat-inducible protein A [Pontivivens insulae]RED11323.1 paraquat-inducible protein A [Pontivivens insulae]SPF29504.1 hypothetical protein POI8812_01815 [Pontivivens insulae]
MKMLNAALLILYPVAWVAPMIETRVFWLLGGGQISLLGGLQTLWSESWPLACLVALLAVIMPYAKVVLTQLAYHRPMPLIGQALPWIARLSMADIFLIALYIVLAKGIAGASVTPQWGLWLFTGCVLLSLWISWRKT